MVILPTLSLFFVLLVGFLKKRIISPLIIYGVMISFYPLFVSMYYEIFGENLLPKIFPNFSHNTVLKFYLISFVSVVGLLIPEIFFGKKYTFVKIEYEKKFEIISYKVFSRIAFYLSVMMLFFIFYNKSIFLDQYIYQALRSSDFDSSVVGVLSLYTTIEVLYLMFLFFAFLLNNNKLEFKSFLTFSLLVFVLIKIMIGSRLMLVPVILLWLFVSGKNINIISSSIKKKIILGSLIPIFILFNIFRDREGQTTIIDGVLNFSFEYIFASVSALYSIEYVENRLYENSYMMFFDGILAIIPSFLLGGANVKYELMSFTNWVDGLGGYLYISPVGGYYFPGQIYLASQSVFGVFLFFFLLGVMLLYAEKKMFLSTSVWKKVISAQICCMLIVYGVRSEFWIFEKVIIQQILLMVFITWALWANLYKYVLCKR